MDYGGKMNKSHGVDDVTLKKAIKLGINKINTDTDLRMAFTGSVREVLKKKPAVFDPRKILGPSRVEIQKLVEHKIKVFGSKGKA